MIYLIYKKHSAADGSAPYRIMTSFCTRSELCSDFLKNQDLAFESLDHLRGFSQSLLRDLKEESCCLLPVDVYNQKVRECSQITELREAIQVSSEVILLSETASKRQSWFGKWF